MEKNKCKISLNLELSPDEFLLLKNKCLDPNEIIRKYIANLKE